MIASNWMHRTSLVNLHNTINLILVAFKEIDYVRSNAHKHSQCANNSRFRVELPWVRCAGVTYILASLDSPSPLCMFPSISPFATRIMGTSLQNMFKRSNFFHTYYLSLASKKSKGHPNASFVFSATSSACSVNAPLVSTFPKYSGFAPSPSNIHNVILLGRITTIPKP